MILQSRYIYSFDELVSPLGTDLDEWKSLVYQKDLIDPLLSSHFARLINLCRDRFGDCEALRTDREIDPVTDVEAHRWLAKFFTFINTTAPKWLSLIEGYEAKKAELLADIKATDIDRAWFNDTPQGSHVTAEGEELSHLSTFNKTARETFDPVGTPSARLAELERNISYYWKAWLDEIYSAFGLEN